MAKMSAILCVTLRKLTFGKKPSTSYYNDRFPVLLTVILYKKYTKTIQKLYKYYTNTIQILYKYYTNTIIICIIICLKTIQILYKNYTK